MAWMIRFIHGFELPGSQSKEGNKHLQLVCHCPEKPVPGKGLFLLWWTASSMHLLGLWGLGGPPAGERWEGCPHGCPPLLLLILVGLIMPSLQPRRLRGSISCLSLWSWMSRAGNLPRACGSRGRALGTQPPTLPHGALVPGSLSLRPQHACSLFLKALVFSLYPASLLLCDLGQIT